MKKIVAMLALAVMATALVACGGDSDSSSTTLKLAADPSGAPKFDKSSLTADAGKITIEFTNQTKTPQNVVIKDQAGKVYAKSNGGEYVTQGSATLSTDLDAGTYIYYSTQPGFEEKGMQGTLTVN
jgi:plastocyanin